MSLFHSDLAKEAILGKFLSDHYSRASLKTKRIYDKAIQLAGVDIILEGNEGLSFKIDEKAQLHYLNKDLPTFALEVNSIQGEVIKDGWLYDPKKITEIYAFVFSIHLIAGSTELKKAEDIESCEVIFVNRITLINELAKLDLNYKVCDAHSKQLRTSEAVTKIEHSSGFNFQLSTHLAEAPVNLVVRKTFLENIGKKFIFKRA